MNVYKSGGRLSGKKVGLPLGTGSPEKARSIVSVVFTPTRGVIHPSFPLRGRWERFAKNGEQAPSPHSPPFTFRHVKRTFTLGNAIRRPSLRLPHRKLRPFLCAHCVWAPNSPPSQNPGHNPIRNGTKLNRESIHVIPPTSLFLLLNPVLEP